MSRSRSRLARLGSMFGPLLVLLGSVGAAAADDAPALARYFPKDGLLLYSEFDGLDAHASAWKRTAAYRMLNETPTGEMLRTVFVQTVDTMLADAGPSKPSAREIAEFFESLSRSGYAFGVTGALGGERFSGAVVVRSAPRATWGKLLEQVSKMTGRVERVTREDGRRVTTGAMPNGGRWSWWFEKDDLVAAFDQGGEDAVEAIIARLTGKTPSAVDNPIRTALRKAENGIEPVMISFVDLASMPPTPPTLGLSGLKRIESRWGFQGEALASTTRVVAPAPRKGLLALLDQPGFTISEGLPIPEGVEEFSIFSFSPAKLYEGATALAREMQPEAAGQIEQIEGSVRATTGLDLRSEILGPMGPRMIFYSHGDRVAIPPTPYHSLAQWFLHLPRLTMMVEAKDEAGFARMADSMATLAERALTAEAEKNGLRGPLGFEKLPGGVRGFAFAPPLAVLPLPVGLEPTLRIENGFAAFSTSGEGAERAVKSAKRPIDPKFAKAIEGMPKTVNMLAVTDPSEYMPEIICNLPFFVQGMAMLGRSERNFPLAGLRIDIARKDIPKPADLRKYLFPSSAVISVDDEGLLLQTRDAVPNPSAASSAPVAVALLLPAVQSARTAARRAQSSNNLKQIMLALHNYHDAHGRFPAPAITDGEGKPLLSWRVAILPYLEQNALYEEFKLDEAWDSPHNKALIAKMPAVFASPNIQPPTPFSTFYQTFVGPGALYEKAGEGTKITDITDGSSNTVAVAEAGRAVVWSKPEDIEYDPDKMVPKLGGVGFPGGANVGFCDGSVRFLSSMLDPDLFRGLITKAGGEVVNID